jgi:choice-of-anchor B domain-containing protein
MISRSLPGHNVDLHSSSSALSTDMSKNLLPRPARPTNGGKPGNAGTLTPGPGVASYNMSLLSRVTLNQLGGGLGSSLHGWVDPQTKREYAIMGRTTGTSFIDITDPRRPVVVANMAPVAGSSFTSWREPKVYQNHVYIGVDGTNHAMQVMDLTRLRTYAGSTMNVAPDSLYTNVTRIHTLAINPDSGFLYAAGTNLASGGLHVIDVRDPANPVAAANWSSDGYTHEAQVITYRGPDAEHVGKELSFSSNGRASSTSDTFTIVDVSNKSNLRRVSSRTYPQSGYIHQGWLTEDQRYYFVNDELDETGNLTGGKVRTHLFDVSDLDAPVYRGFFEQAGGIDHNLYVKGDLLFQSNYTTGLRVFKIGDLESNNPADWLREIGYYDTYGASDGVTFNGAWNNYPYFPSGNIAISDIDGGLFVVKLDSLDPRPANLTAVPEPATLTALVATLAAASARRRRL